MPIKCKLCFHPKRVEIESRILSGTLTNVDASKVVGCSDTSIRRHMQNHVSKVLRNIGLEQPKKGVMDAFDILNNTIDTCNELINEAKQNKNYPLLLKAMAQMVDNLSLAARIFELNKKNDDNNFVIEVKFVEPNNQQ